jgi:hypothetical protein
MRKPTDAQYRKNAAELAFSFSPRIYPCAKCGWAVADGYCCGTCGDANPKQAADAVTKRRA